MRSAFAKRTLACRAAACLAVASLPALSLVGGCSKGEDDVRVYTSPKESPATKPAAKGGTAAAMADPPKWTLPAGWTQVSGGGTDPRFPRYMTITPSADQPAVNVSVMPVTPRPLAENVNRWERMLGLTPSADADVESNSPKATVGDAEARLVDLTGKPADGKPAERMLAAIVDHDGSQWSFRLQGPVDVVGGHKANFEALIRSVRFHDEPAPAAAKPPTVGPMGPAAPAAVPAGVTASTEPKQASNALLGSFMLPAGWVEDPTPRAMRAGTFVVQPGEKQAELIVSKLGGEFGSMTDNVNRWRRFVGLPDGPAVNEADVPTVKIGSRDAHVWDFAGPDEANPTKRQTVVMIRGGGSVYFFRLIGHPETVAANRAALTQFVESLKLGA